MYNRFVVMISPDEADIETLKKSIRISDGNDIQFCVNDVASIAGGRSICVYEVTEIHRVVQPAVYNTYKVNKKGEVIPA